MHIMQADPTRFGKCIMQTHAVMMSLGNKYSQVTEWKLKLKRCILTTEVNGWVISCSVSGQFLVLTFGLKFKHKICSFPSILPLPVCLSPR